MPYSHINAARDARQVHNLTPAVGHVLLVIATRVDDDGWSFPSIPGLMADTGHGARTVRRAVALLEAAGVLEVERRTGRASRYRVTEAADPLPSDPGFIPNPLPSDPGSYDPWSSDPGSHGTTPPAVRPPTQGPTALRTDQEQINEQKSAPETERDADPLAAVIGSPEIERSPHVAATLARVAERFAGSRHPAEVDAEAQRRADGDAVFAEVGARRRARAKAGYRVARHPAAS